MLEAISPLESARAAIRAGTMTIADVARSSAMHANANASANTYIRFDAEELMADALDLQRAFPDGLGGPSLLGIPISLKDCFDQAGMATTCGSRFYAGREPATEDSGMAVSLHQAGALITGKTHLHPLAYGITGQNPEYGDCVQPRDASLLTGGSSSGAAASVQEGSALAAIGTDTGGSIRVPAALCGLAGYRASQAIAGADGWWPEAWSGAAHLAASFDTPGLLVRDPRDLASLAQALFHVPVHSEKRTLRIGCVGEKFLWDAEAGVIEAMHTWKRRLIEMDVVLEDFVPLEWADTYEIFAGIQASEAAALHAGHFDQFEASIRSRLEWGASLDEEHVGLLHARRLRFCESLQKLFSSYDLLMLPAAPVSALRVGTDLTNARQTILRYTTPFSLAGLPALSLPGEIVGAQRGTGIQVAAPSLGDPLLLAFGREVGEALARN